MPYKESHEFVASHKSCDSEKAQLLQYVLANTPANDPLAVINCIEFFCRSTWMMNVGLEKGEIIQIFLKRHKPATILELGGYCGFSALLFAHYSQATIHTIEIDQTYANIAHRIHQHAGVADRIIIHVGIVQTQENFLKEHGKFDMIFIDHLKNIYLQDFLELQRLQVIKKGTVVMGDNIIFPGSPDYLKHFQENQHFDSVLYHSFVEYSDVPDAILISEKIAQ